MFHTLLELLGVARLCSGIDQPGGGGCPLSYDSVTMFTQFFLISSSDQYSSEAPYQTLQLVRANTIPVLPHIVPIRN